MLLRNLILNERRPLYTQAEWAARVEPALLGLRADAQPVVLNDDRVGRALDLLFQADRASLMTELVLRTIREFHIDLDQLHNDSTTITFSGQYAGADGHVVRGQPTLHVTYGHNNYVTKLIMWPSRRGALSRRDLAYHLPHINQVSTIYNEARNA